MSDHGFVNLIIVAIVIVSMIGSTIRRAGRNARGGQNAAQGVPPPARPAPNVPPRAAALSAVVQAARARASQQAAAQQAAAQQTAAQAAAQQAAAQQAAAQQAAAQVAARQAAARQAAPPQAAMASVRPLALVTPLDAPAPASFAGRALVATFTDARRTRDAVVLMEILAPPLALR